MKTPITYYGGKQLLAKRIVSIIPSHRIYCEPFLGGGAVFFSKEPSKIEVINDTNKELINFYRVIKTKYKQLEKEIKTTVHSRYLHRKAAIIYNYPELFSEVQRAWALWVQAAQSYASILDSTWSYDKTNNTTVSRMNSKRFSFTKEYAERLENAQIECKDALYIIKTRDTKDSFFYCDPPYHNADQGHYKGYTENDFENLLQTLSKIKGRFLLSSYPSDLLKKYIKENNWYSKEIEMKMCMANNPQVKTKRKIEVLTANYPIELKESNEKQNSDTGEN